MNKLETINYQGNDYATVPVRLKQFRESNPRAVIETRPEFQPDGTIVFSARIVKDKADPDSAEATGHSWGKNEGEKAFEKLETVATGRALSLLGYLNNGQVASTEEMQEFEAYQMEKVVEEIHTAENREDFAAILAKLNPAQKREVTPIINKRIKELKEQDNANANQS